MARSRRDRGHRLRGIDPPPASTGIGGGPVPDEHDLCLGVHAIRGARPPERTVMSTSTLNEATLYGSDFTRGMGGQGRPPHLRVADVVSAITYLKRPADAEPLRRKLREAGFEGFPNVLVLAPVCRPELLCETEALAVLPRSATRPC